MIPKPGALIHEPEARRLIVSICHRLHARNCLAAADGNVSYRLDDGRILITPTGRNKALLTESELAVITLDNTIVEGEPSGERLMHLAVYRACSKARAVVHAHPPTAVAWSIARPELAELPSEGLSEVILATGRIPFVPYARPSTPDMGTHLLPFLPDCRVLILSRHGALSWGESLEEAHNGIERLEHSCQILATADGLGGITSLPADEIAALREMRRKLGERTL